MLDALKPQPADALLALIRAFQDDPRADKLDLGVGVYRDEHGNTPVFRAIKAAERRLLDEQATKAYLGPEGDLRFVELLRPIAFGASDPGTRLTGVQTPGGTGALRLAAELIAAAKPGARIHLGLPSWPNHAPIFAAARLEVVTFPYFDIVRQQLDFAAMIAAFEGARAGDVVLLNGCCHNPTGADLDLAQWDAVAEIVARRGLFPLIDFAYQGLGRGLEPDAAGFRRVLDAVDEALIAYSCDKNFGIYRERTGAVYAKVRDAEAAGTVLGNLAGLARVNWSMPPDHGAAAVRLVLDDPALTQDWRTELDGMCARINAVRAALAAADSRLSFLTRQQGLFCNLAMPAGAVARMRTEHGVYMAGSGRMNLAGLQVSDAPKLVAALAAVGALSEVGAEAA
jgi:aromatic-amino-acid transaminase